MSRDPEASGFISLRDLRRAYPRDRDGMAAGRALYAAGWWFDEHMSGWVRPGSAAHRDALRRDREAAWRSLGLDLAMFVRG